MHKSKVFVMSLVFILLMSMSFGMGTLAEENNADIVDTAVAADDFNTLVAAVQAADLVDALKGDGPFTVFAPTDEAFATALEELGLTAEELLASDQLVDILLYHVVEGKVMSSDLEDGMQATTLNGESIAITLDPVQVNGVNVVTPDVEASNGVIHIIDAVLLPPTEEATEEETTEEEATEEESSLVDIVETAVAAGNFETLLAAAEAAGLVDALKGEGPLTVFAPTDEAFANLLDALEVTGEELLAREDLADILLYHVVAGKVMSTDLEDGAEVETLNGAKVTISLGNSVQVNDATVVTADFEASNGVIHVIDTVLIPTGDVADEEEAAEEINAGATESGDATPAIPQTSNNSVLIYVLLAVIAGGIALFFIRKEKIARV
ncbi:fasciclin domain-containing protein [Alkalihalobacterium elongatum]|uniref:fasciclin domain-containing protein n=1 Tax=Alkalihalobacterium elongatum TaxID=2675466 RepID=UPI001F1CAD58|nr:fasciclin domain-containing protein [Alkalihalobacterium elongatum]